LKATGPEEKIVVLGMGNSVVSDDRVGLAVAEQVRALLDESPIANVVVSESTRGGLELIDLLSGYRHAIIVDCLTLPDPRPGRVVQLSLGEVSGSARLVNAHEISIAEAFALAAHLGIDMPETVEIYAVEGGDTTTVSEQMTPPVEAAVLPLARRIHASLAKRAVERQDPATT